ncbi:MAG: TetR/AcrR family transcriptional regulator [Armatimonadetes bacterium]|nr:TetR/AcrR family transcriptional regulator [Armatimonadota bacterium]
MARTAAGDIRQRILEAAEERLWRYGFRKTTIDEIAGDAGVGKGTVYLHFDSKEDIGLAIIAQFKEANLTTVQEIARDSRRETVQKLKDMLASPILTAHRRCIASPEAQEMVIAVRPHIQARMRPYLEHEIALIAEVLEEGNQRGIFAVSDTMQAARTLKSMTHGLLPPFPFVTDLEEMQAEIGRMVDLAVRGLRRCD